MGRRKEKESYNKKNYKSRDREKEAEDELNKEKEEEGNGNEEEIINEYQFREFNENKSRKEEFEGLSSSSPSTTTILVNSDTDLDIYNNSIELLNEKKATSRLKGLEQILNIFQISGLNNIPMNSLDTLRICLLRIIKHPTSTNEGILSAQILSVISLLIGPNDEFIESYFQPLKHIITRVDDESLRQQILFTLVFMTFICSTDRSDCFTWALCEELLLLTSEGLDVTPKLRFFALKYWCLLGSVINPELVLEHSRDGVFEVICTILDDNDTEGKIIAGESLAFLWEMATLILPEGDNSQLQRLICEDVREFDNLMSLVRQIGRDSSKKISKKEKKERKGTMKIVLDYILEDIPPEDIIELKGAELEVSTFSVMLLVQTLREVLLNGFQNCLQSFPITRDLLQIEFVSEAQETDDLDAKQRHNYYDRQRTGYRKEDRRVKELSFYAENEDF